MMGKIDDVLDTPLAELQMFGLSLQTIGLLEAHFGIYIRDVVFRRRDELGELPLFGKQRMETLLSAVGAVLGRNGITIRRRIEERSDKHVGFEQEGRRGCRD